MPLAAHSEVTGAKSRHISDGASEETADTSSALSEVSSSWTVVADASPCRMRCKPSYHRFNWDQASRSLMAAPCRTLAGSSDIKQSCAQAGVAQWTGRATSGVCAGAASHVISAGRRRFTRRTVLWKAVQARKHRVTTVHWAPAPVMQLGGKHALGTLQCVLAHLRAG